MYISAILPFNISTSKNQKKDGNFSCVRATSLNKTNFDTITFGTATSAGSVLKKLKNINCPYFGVKMISGSDLTRISKYLDHCFDIGQVVRYLSNYTENLQNTEKNMFLRFAAVAEDNAELTLPELLQDWYTIAKTKLKLEEFSVLDDVDKIAMELSPQTALKIREKTTKCRDIIIKDNQDNPFKRKTLLSSLEEIIPEPDEIEALEYLKDKAMYLPTSGSSENAFIVKYASRSQEEIAKRLIRSSVATIEHIIPESLGGKNELSNFILVSSSANSYRSNMPLPKFIEMFPDIPKNCQVYINQIIKHINRGGLKGFQAYPYQIRQTLLEQSEGIIDLTIPKFKYTEHKANKITKRYAERKLKHRDK